MALPESDSHQVPESTPSDEMKELMGTDIESRNTARKLDVSA